MAVVDSDATRDAILAQVQVTTQRIGTEQFWIGLNQGQDAAWGWRDGTPFDYTNWHPKAPRNLSGEGVRDCGFIGGYTDPVRQHHAWWRDWDCNYDERRAICIRPEAIEYEYNLTELTSWAAAKAVCEITYGSELAVLNTQSKVWAINASAFM